jgi:hypothetical protein
VLLVLFKHLIINRAVVCLLALLSKLTMDLFRRKTNWLPFIPEQNDQSDAYLKQLLPREKLLCRWLSYRAFSIDSFLVNKGGRKHDRRASLPFFGLCTPAIEKSFVAKCAISQRGTFGGLHG